MMKALERSVLWVFLLIPFFAFSQGKELRSIELKEALKVLPSGQTLPVYLRGDTDAIAAFVRGQGGRLKAQFGNIVSCDLPAASFDGISNHDFISYIEYSHSRPVVLNDVMITNNNIHPVHQGVYPLPEAYRGEDVIIGFIDTGIEINHPDFQHADGSTRVIALWDQTQDETIPLRIPQPYGYGQEWTAEDIDAGISNHNDQAQYSGHGSNVAGIGVGNANATGDFPGVAPEADIIVVSSDFSRPNWKSSVAEAVDFIFARAAAIGKPVVVNASLGDYYGSHDALDGPALYIDSLISAAPGRAMVAAAGNSDQFPLYHLGYEVPETDTAFTWFTFNPNSSLGYGAVFFEYWADVEDFENTHFSIGADLTTPAYEFRGYANWRTATSNLNQIITDTIFYGGAILGIVDTWCGQRGDQYHIQVVVRQPFSAQYRWRFATTGGGIFDCWSYAAAGTSGIVSTGLPSVATYAEMAKYRMPDRHKTIVDSWTCSDKVITVGNYVNRDNFVNILGTVSTFDYEPGSISVNTSRGPTRDLRQKPDIAASGDVTLAAGKLATLNALINSNPQKVSESGMHYSNGGTSMSSPVVAGVAALYFSRCSMADFSDVKQAIIDHAIADAFTGSLPGPQMGWGKIDAWATLSSSVSPIDVSSPADALCDGEVMELVAEMGYSNYTWNNGGEGSTLSIDSGGNYFVEANDAKGCLQRSETLGIETLESPEVPFIEFENEELLAVGEGASWQWYLDDTPIDGANQSSFQPLTPGVYTVEAIGPNGCSTSSLPYFFGVVGVAETGFDELQIYPNPASDVAVIDFGNLSVAQWAVYDLSGRLLSAGLVNSSEKSFIHLDLYGLSSGVYVVHLQMKNSAYRHIKLVVEN